MALKFPAANRLKPALKMCEKLKTELAQIRAKYWEYQAANVQAKLEKLEEAKSAETSGNS